MDDANELDTHSTSEYPQSQHQHQVEAEAEAEAERIEHPQNREDQAYSQHEEEADTAHSQNEEASNTQAAAPVEEEQSELRRRRRVGGEEDAGVETATTTARTEKENDEDNAKAKGKDAEPKGAMAEPASDEFSCNICFDTATAPVLTICGHLFCWSCLVQWLERSATCPVCKAGCDKEKVIPVYGRGREQKDPRLDASIPNRPAGQRPPAPPPRQPGQFFGFDPFGVPGSFHTMGMPRTRMGGGAVFVGGLGFLPMLMGFSSFSVGSGANGAAAAGQAPPAGRQAFASRVFMMLAAMVLMSIIFY
ncbi:hypothetical protein GGI07_002283 [Coemansia sp. Benny D115]|nr:hypothetical protein GGI07_002283 [Coemansia sp. Benny D115]